MATKQNLFLDQLATYVAVINVASSNSLPINLTGFTGVSQIKKHYSSLNVTSSFIVSINGAAGQITLSMDANTSGNICAGRYVYDVLILDGSGNYTRILEGMLTVTPAVSDYVVNTILIEVESNISGTILANGVVDSANNLEQLRG